MKPHRISIGLPAPLIAAVLSLSISGPLAAFSGHGEAGDSGPYTGPSGLVYTVETEGGFVGIAVTNLAEAEIRLVFMTGQRYEFVLLDGSVEKYRWSAGRMFTQMISEMVLQPGESKE